MKLLITNSLLVIISSGIFHTGDATSSAPRVVTASGAVIGIYANSSEGYSYSAFLGIPYAEPITSQQRFKIAKIVTPWNGDLYAKHYGPSCVQVSFPSEVSGNPTVIGSEDCLTLNIFTPTGIDRNRTKNHLSPVIIYLHGGAFLYGGSELFGPDYLLNEDVILATVNYRLGAHGFLSTESCLVPGNMGLKDQLLAMRWIKRNIRYFGGDPEKITLIGQGAGGASGHFHLLTKKTRGLYSGVMSLSGSAVSPWALTENSLEKAKKLATILGCGTSDVEEMIACLRFCTAEDIALASVQFKDWVLTPPTPFGPVIEPEFCPDVIIDRPPIASIIFNTGVDVPWIVGTVAKEGLDPGSLFINNPTLLKELDEYWLQIAPSLLDFKDTIPEFKQNEISLLIREHYFGNSSIGNSTIEQSIRIISDRWLKADTGQAAILQGLSWLSPVKLYSFDYRGNHSTTEILTGTSTDYGVAHGDDVIYTLNSEGLSITTQEDREMQKILIKLWVSFAANGVPDVGIEWPELDAIDYIPILRIDGPDNIYIYNETNFGDIDFWDTIDFNENKL